MVQLAAESGRGVAKPKRFAYSVFVIKVRDLLKRLAEDGWVQVRQTGSHRQFRHPTKPGTVAIAGHPSDTLRPGTYQSILRHTGLKDER
jgi:predicted RNA binding protein YcfA (HicA-like mRNA interferase family)